MPRTKKPKTYPIADTMMITNDQRLPGNKLIARHSEGDRTEVQAMATGEYRRPECGEFYLSGRHTAAYCAPSDLSTAYPIARIVHVRIVTKETKTIIKEV